MSEGSFIYSTSRIDSHGHVNKPPPTPPGSRQKLKAQRFQAKKKSRHCDRPPRPPGLLKYLKMLAAFRTQSLRSVSRSLLPSCSLIHTSSPNLAQATKKSAARAIKKKNEALQSERKLTAQLSRPSVVLGTRPADEAVKWANCDLAKVLVDEAEFTESPELVGEELPVGTVYLPKQLGFGIQEADRETLFRDLPLLSAHSGLMSGGINANAKVLAERSKEGLARELKKANAFAKVVDLRNASGAGIAFENRRRIIEAFSGPVNTFDPGRSEVQAAILTYRIRSLWTHLTRSKRDVGNRLGLRKLVHKRAKVLKYLKRVSRTRYDTILRRLALEPDSVEGELVV